MCNENVDFTWLREALIMHLLPCGKTGNQLDGAGGVASPNIFKTDKPIVFFNDKYPGIHHALGASGKSEWLIFCYSPLPYYKLSSAFFKVVFEQALNASTENIKGKALEKYKSLILLAALHARAELTNSPSVVTTKRLSQIMKMKPQSWRTTWAERWDLLIKMFKEYDSAGLKFVAWSINNDEQRVS